MNDTTTIRVSKKTAQALENLRAKLDAQNLDETIRFLVKKQRKAVLTKCFGTAKNLLKPYTEVDRGEDRN
jgi:superfamily I DNA and RNA helicase